MKELFRDEEGKISVKRVCGLFCTITLCITMYRNSFLPREVAPSDTLVSAVTALAFGCLGLTTVDKIFGKSKAARKEKSTEDQG